MGYSNSDLSIKDFIQKELDDVCSKIDVDPRILLPKRSEKFVQKILKDKKGDLVVNETVHNIMHRFRRKAHKRGFRRIMCLGAYGLGKSMISGTYVLMYDCTMKLVDDIQVGDLLMGPDSKPRKVLFLGSDIEPAYRITLSNKDFFECNESHKLSLKVSRDFYGYKRGEIVTVLLTEYLELPDWIKIHCLKLYKVPLEFLYKETPIDPYLYGTKVGNFRTKHRKIKTQLYSIWASMKERCVNPNCKFYHCYGGRGIQFDPKWDSFLGFKEDMQIKYLYAKKQLKVRQLSIERVNVNGHYCKENCIFIEKIDQGKNTRRTKQNKNIPDVNLDYFDNNDNNIEFYRYINKVYLQNDRNVRLQVLAGILDIHGTKPSKKFKLYRIKIKEDDDLRDSILFLCRSLGFSVSWVKVVSSKNAFSYMIIISGDINKIPCRINKVYSNFKKIYSRNRDLEYSFKVEPIGEKRYFGFGVDKDHLFLHHDLTSLKNTEQLCIGFSLYLLAKDPEALIKIVHVSEEEAINRVRAIRDYIARDKDFKEMCPHITPTIIWGSKKLIINRKGFSKDPSVQAFSILSGALGGRATCIIFDDPQDLRTAVLEPTTRETIEMTFKNVWLSRMVTDENAEVIVMMNKWHDFDLSAYIMNNPQWAWMQIGVNEDKESLFYKDSFGVDRKIPLWSKFGKQEFINRHREIGDRDFNRGYRLIPYSDKDKTFPNFENCCHYGIRPKSVIDDSRDWVFVGGIDFAGMKRPGTTLIICGLNKHTGKKIPVEIFTFIGTSGLIEVIVETWKIYGTEVYNAENDAVQSTIIDMLITELGEGKLKKYGIKIEGVTTGKSKADPITGLPAIQKEFENNEWMFCFERQFNIDDDKEKNLWYRLFQEFKHHPFHPTSDFVMSIFFCRKAMMQFMRTGGGPNLY